MKQIKYLTELLDLQTEEEKKQTEKGYLALIEQHAEEIGEAGTNNNFDQTAIFGQRFDRKGNLIK